MSNKPTHTAYVVRKATREGGKDFWTAIGSAWPVKDGEGFSIKLDALPIGGEIVILPRREAEEG